MWQGYESHTKEEINELIIKYPWLKNTATDEYCVTWLDDLEPGWRHNFGNELCEELAKALALDECEDSFEFAQIKEKYGSLRLYAGGYGEYTKEVLAKYEELSKYICGHCGNVATQITQGWIYPLCDDCVKDPNIYRGKATPITEFYNMSHNEIITEISNIRNNFHYHDYWKTLS